MIPWETYARRHHCGSAPRLPEQPGRRPQGGEAPRLDHCSCGESSIPLRPTALRLDPETQCLLKRGRQHVGARCLKKTANGRIEQVDITRGYLVDDTAFDTAIRSAIFLPSLVVAYLLPALIVYRIARLKKAR